MPAPRLIDLINAKGISDPTYANILGRANLIREGQRLKQWLEEDGARTASDAEAVRLAALYVLNFPQMPPGPVTSAQAQLARKSLKRIFDTSPLALGEEYSRGLCPIEPPPEWLFKPDEIAGVPVVVADNVHAYLSSLGKFQFKSVVSRVRPQFRKMFVELRATQPDSLGAPETFHEGVFFEVLTKRQADFLFFGQPKWSQSPDCYVRARTLIQRGRENVVGPIGDFLLALDKDGRIIESDGELRHGMRGMTTLDSTMTTASVEKMIEQTALHPMVPALMTISLMHCKNVKISQVDPNTDLPERRTRHQKPRKEYERYATLEIGAIKNVTDRSGAKGEAGLEQALHFVRGHYKTFNPDAPLFGKHTGEYFWADQVRGSAEVGINTNDYNVTPPSMGLGR